MNPTRRRWLRSTALLAAAGAGACTTARAPAPAQTAGEALAEWETADARRAGIDPAAWSAAVEAAAGVPGLRSLLVVHDGKLIAERYLAGASAAERLPINSATKSVVSLLVGQALAQGRIAGLFEPLHRLLPGDAVAPSAAAQVTLGQILVGRSGIAWDLAADATALATADDPLAYALRLPLEAATPAAWRYNDASVGLLSSILAQAQGLDLAALAQRDLFAPLGIAGHDWRRDRAGRPTAYGGLALRSRDLMKLAWMALDGGRWRGNQIVPAAWLGDAMRPHGEAGWRVAPVADIGYGYLWFTGRLGAQRIAWAWGYGGQYAVLVPGLRLAVTTLATSPPPARLGGQTQDVMALVARLVSVVAAS